MLLFVFLACHETKAIGQQKQVFSVAGQKTVGYTEMLDALAHSQVVFIGESHDNQAHHQMQLDVIKALHGSGAPLAVGFEMFTAKNQAILDAWVAGGISQEEFIKVYYDNWNFPWPLYRDILMYVRDNKIPAVGLNIEPAISRKVAQSGFSSLTKEEIEKLPPDIGCSVDKQYMDFIRRAHAMHGHENKNFLFFCQAQILWDQVMARNIVNYLQKNPGKTVVVIAGRGHAWKRGIPEQIRLLAGNIKYKVILPFIPGHIESRFITTGDADYLLPP